MKTVAIAAIRAYQELFPPWRKFGGGRQRCVYHPSCSRYAIDAIRNAGFLRGGLYAFLRVARCHPWQEPRVDHFSDRLPG